MIAHLDNGKSIEIRPGAATMGLRVVRWEFDFNDMRKLLANPELLEIFATRMLPITGNAPRARLAQPERYLKFSGAMHVVCKCDKCIAQPEPEREQSYKDKPCIEDDGCPTEKAVLQRFWRKHQQPEPSKLWLWKNFVDGKPEYWAFDNPYPTNLDNGDPQTLGQPCGYAIFKPSRDGSHGRTEEQVLREINAVKERD